MEENKINETEELEDVAEVEEEAKEEDSTDYKALSEENYNRYLRLAAEFDNYKKRTQKEKEDTYSFAVCDTVNEILPVIDNLERAVIAAKDASDESMAEGVNMVLTQFIETLKKIGVEEIASVGEVFDPNLHNAVMHVDDDSFGENTVCEEFAKGYHYKGKVIRYSMVKVAN